MLVDTTRAGPERQRLMRPGIGCGLLGGGCGLGGRRCHGRELVLRT
ncbi:hypothetical protein [Amycolatopsis viridis]|uniref:Lipoprotein n=1 Tax=Amycolatopsis viridis TaxID=185678 RepID=A0ABX0SQJ2_9PSEU|nr:hypothetical protein [Amycolatopsis viridis]NIH79163.1 hypothetical protein [Amycolatopsis viridis]